MSKQKNQIIEGNITITAKADETAPADDNVVVLCKIPNGLKVHVNGKEHIINGSHDKSSASRFIVGIWGKTVLPRSIWAQISDKYKAAPWLKKGYVKAEELINADTVAKNDMGKTTGYEGANVKDKAMEEFQADKKGK